MCELLWHGQAAAAADDDVKVKAIDIKMRWNIFFTLYFITIPSYYFLSSVVFLQWIWFLDIFFGFRRTQRGEDRRQK